MIKPNLSPKFLDWVRSNDFSNKILLELGSGDSTIFFSQYFKKVYSYEDDVNYYENLKKNLSNNVDYKLFNKNIFKDIDFKHKVSESDVFLIDNHLERIPRDQFAFYIHKNKKPFSIIVLDNGDWNYRAYEFLRSNYYCYDFLKIDETENNELTQTTVFFHPRVKK